MSAPNTRLTKSGRVTAQLGRDRTRDAPEPSRPIKRSSGHAVALKGLSAYYGDKRPSGCD